MPVAAGLTNLAKIDVATQSLMYTKKVYTEVYIQLRETFHFIKFDLQVFDGGTGLFCMLLDYNLHRTELFPEFYWILLLFVYLYV